MGSPLDHYSKYLTDVLRFVGITDVAFVGGVSARPRPGPLRHTPCRFRAGVSVRTRTDRARPLAPALGRLVLRPPVDGLRRRRRAARRAKDGTQVDPTRWTRPCGTSHNLPVKSTAQISAATDIAGASRTCVRRAKDETTEATTKAIEALAL